MSGAGWGGVSSFSAAPAPPPLPEAAAKAKAAVSKLVAKGLVDNAAVRAALEELGEGSEPYAADFAEEA